MNAFQLVQRSILLFLTIITAFSCTKDLNIIGLDLVSQGELLKLGYTDTLQIVAYSEIEDSVRTANLSVALIGSMNDPVFGTTTADWFSQIHLSKEAAQFGINAVFDSAFLTLPYSGSYGDILSNMTVKVYQLKEGIYDSIHSYSTSTITYDQDHVLGELTFTPRPNDSSFFEGEKHSPMLRIPLKPWFGELMIGADTSNFSTNAKFVSYIKGIAIVTDPQQNQGAGAMLKMTATSGSSKITMYYHNSTDTSSFSFVINSDCKRFNHFTHNNYTDCSSLMKQQIDGDTTLGKQFLFLQTMGGIRVKLRFPNLKTGFNGKAAVINDARLFLTNASPSVTFTPPASLSLYSINDNGTMNTFALPDYNEGEGYFGGTYSSNSGNYVFRLTSYIQQVINGLQNNNGLYLFIPQSSLTGGRLVLNGTDSPSSSLKLLVKYTYIKE